MGKSKDLATGKFTEVVANNTGSNTNIRVQNTASGSGSSDGFLIQNATNNKVYLWNYESADVLFGTNGTERMKIDGLGRVTKPNQPSFEAYRTSGDASANTVVVFNNTRHNVGNHYNTSNGLFTAPIAGRYLFTIHAFTDGSNAIHQDLQVNGSNRVRNQQDANSSYRSSVLSAVFQLAVNDVVRVYSHSTAHYNNSGLYSNFCGHLLG